MIRCSRCQGKGKRELSRPLTRVLETIVSLGQPTCPQIFEKIKGDYRDRTVANIYVNRLLKLKLIRKLSGNGDRTPRYEKA
jgi:hypothetical protein